MGNRTRVIPALAILAYIIAIVLGVAPLGLFVVLGYSMWPTLSPGDIVVGVNTMLVEPVEGDIVVYRDGYRQIVHRLVGFTSDDIAITRGDYVGFNDRPVPLDNIRYSIVLQIPFAVWMPLAGLVLSVIYRDVGIFLTMAYLTLVVQLMIATGVETMKLANSIEAVVASHIPETSLVNMTVSHTGLVEAWIRVDGISLYGVEWCSLEVAGVEAQCSDVELYNTSSGLYMFKTVIPSSLLARVYSMYGLGPHVVVVEAGLEPSLGEAVRLHVSSVLRMKPPEARIENGTIVLVNDLPFPVNVTVYVQVVGEEAGRPFLVASYNETGVIEAGSEYIVNVGSVQGWSLARVRMEYTGIAGGQVGTVYAVVRR